MGFFDSKKTSKSESTYDNPELRQYTAAYRGVAPWGFSFLDPNASLFAMGAGTELGGTDLGAEGKAYLQGLSAEEKAQKTQTSDALARMQARQESGQFITAQESEFINRELDKAFEFAHKTGYEDWTKATQMMAGSRGMRMSDTPVAEPAMKELRNFELGLGSKRAELGLAASMDMGKNNQEFDMAIASFNKQLEQNKWATQQGHIFGGGLQAAGQLGFKTTEKSTVTSKMSGFQKVMAGFQMANATLDLGGRIASGIKSGGMDMGNSPTYTNQNA